MRFQYGHSPSSVVNSGAPAGGVPNLVQIVADIMAQPKTLDNIIAAKGCVVPDEDFRSGRRVRRSDGSGDCDQKVRKRQRVSTNTRMELHPDCTSALAILDVASVIEQVGSMEEDAEDHAPDDAAMSPPPAPQPSNAMED
jgi:hypothetical protein